MKPRILMVLTLTASLIITPIEQAQAFNLKDLLRACCVLLVTQGVNNSGYAHEQADTDDFYGRHNRSLLPAVTNVTDIPVSISHIIDKDGCCDDPVTNYLLENLKLLSQSQALTQDPAIKQAISDLYLTLSRRDLDKLKLLQGLHLMTRVLSNSQQGSMASQSMHEMFSSFGLGICALCGSAMVLQSCCQRCSGRCCQHRAQRHTHSPFIAPIPAPTMSDDDSETHKPHHA